MRTVLAAQTALMLFATPVAAGNLDDGQKAYSVKDYIEAMRLFKHEHLLGSGHAAPGIGEMYRDGEGMPEDVVKVVCWHRGATADSKFC